MFTADRLFFTSDTHFGHRNIIKYSKRPFESVEDMDSAMIRRWNAVVGEDDAVCHLGDVALDSPERTAEILDRLHGRIYLIRGNHDRSATHALCRDRFEWIRELTEIRVDDPEETRPRAIILCHYAMRVWNKAFHGSWHLYGHSHGQLPDDPQSRSFDVGVDCHDFKPISYWRVKDIMSEKVPRERGGGDQAR